MENTVQKVELTDGLIAGSEIASAGNVSDYERPVGYCPSEEVLYENSIARVLKHYRPRGALARTLYQKQIFDEQLRNTDKRQVSSF